MKIRALLIASVACLAWSTFAAAQSPASTAVAAQEPAPSPPSSPAAAPAATPAQASARNAVQNPAPNPALGGLPPHEAMAIVRANGFDPVGPPVRSGAIWVVRAYDPYDLPVRVAVDARSGRIVSVGEPTPRYAGPFSYRSAPMYDPYDGPVYGRIFGGYGPPRPPRTVPTVKPKVTDAAPVPRPRPYVRDATGSINTPASHAPPAPQTDPAKNGGAAMPPVAPLD